MKCSNCGYNIAPGNKFCRNCGTSMIDMESDSMANQEEIIKICSVCGVPLQEGYLFCKNCRTPVTNVIERKSTINIPYNKTTSEIPQSTIQQKDVPVFIPPKEENISTINYSAASSTRNYRSNINSQPSEKKNNQKSHTAVVAVMGLIAVCFIIFLVSNIQRKKSTENTVNNYTNDAYIQDDKYRRIYETNNIDIWDTRFPTRPSSIYQTYYVIFNKGTMNNRIEMSVFDINGNLDGNYLCWNGEGSAIELKYSDTMTNCDQYYYDLSSNSWIMSVKDYCRVTDSADAVISSNLDICDMNGNLIMEHISKYGSNSYIDYSYYNEYFDLNSTFEYILPGSDSRYISESELWNLNQETCRIARNEIYARHGRKFKDEGLKNYFNQFEWYSPTIEPDDFSESLLNEYEIENRDLIVKYEKEHGWQ